MQCPIHAQASADAMAEDNAAAEVLEGDELVAEDLVVVIAEA